MPKIPPIITKKLKRKCKLHMCNMLLFQYNNQSIILIFFSTNFCLWEVNQLTIMSRPVKSSAGPYSLIICSPATVCGQS